jgi:outer membrane protein assembly complex protein YaeT
MQAMDRCLPPVWMGTGALLSLLLWTVSGLSQAPPPTTQPVGKYVVADVKVQGNTATSTERIRSIVKIRPGTEFSQEVINEDVRKLMATGLFSNVWPQLVPQQNGNAVDVCFVVYERPGRIQDIQYNGAKHLGKLEELASLTGLHKGDPMVPWRNQEAAKRIQDKCFEQGRPLATVRLVEGASPTDSRVIFDITEGPKVKVRHIDFLGAAFVPPAVLRTHTKSSRAFLGLLGGKYNPLLVDHDITELEDYYKSFGYHDIRISREVSYVDGEHVDIIYHIQEGLRYRVANRPQVEGVGKEMPREDIEALPRLRAGEPYSQAKVDGDINLIKDRYGWSGRDVRVRPEVFHPGDTPGLCQVVYRVEERPPSRVGLVYIVGNEVTRQNVILRQLPEGLCPGQILSYPDLRVAERNLAKLNIFEMNPETGVRPTVEVLDRDGSLEFKDLLVRVQETRTGSLMFGVGVNSDAGVAGSVVLNERNFDITRFPTSFDDFLAGRAFRGAGQEFRLEAVPGTQVQRYTATWREPFLFDSPYSLTVGGYYYDRIFNEYNESRVGGRVTVGRQLNKYWTASTSLRIENVGVNDVSYFAPPEIRSVIGSNFLVGVSAGVTRDTRDSYLRATEGSLLDIRFEQVFGEFTYPLVNVDFNKYWTIYQRADGSGRHVLAMHNQVALAGAQTPVYDAYYAGGFRSMRGFEFRGISPENPLYPGFKIGGDFMLLNSLEYQLPVLANDHLFLVAFVDSGTVERSIELRNYRVSAGVGVRFVVPMLGPVPIALDFGFPIVKADQDREQIFSFWVGFFH